MCNLVIFAALLGSALGAVPVPCSNPVTVTVKVKDTWCKASHPHDFQADVGGDGPISWPHISWPVVHTHDGTHPSWDDYATQGIGRTVEDCGTRCQSFLAASCHAATPPGQALGPCVDGLAVSPAV